MPRINLLQWREELRKQRQQAFYMAILGSVLLAGILVAATSAYFQGKIEHQEARNKYLEDEIALLDAQIDEIKELETVKGTPAGAHGRHRNIAAVAPRSRLLV